MFTYTWFLILWCYPSYPQLFLCIWTLSNNDWTLHLGLSDSYATITEDSNDH